LRKNHRQKCVRSRPVRVRAQEIRGQIHAR
jgi:hypothetical protein